MGQKQYVYEDLNSLDDESQFAILLPLSLTRTCFEGNARGNARKNAGASGRTQETISL